MAMHGGNGFAFCFALFFVDLRERLFRRAQLSDSSLKCCLLFAHLAFELQDFRVQRAQFALHAERTHFVRAASCDHAALIASAIGRNESVLRVFACQFFRR